MKYLLNNEITTEEIFWNEYEKAIYSYVEENIDEIIDEENEIITIGSLTYYASDVLKNTDPVAYRCYISDTVDYFYGDYKYSLEREEEVEIDGSTFQILEDESEAE